MKFATVTKSITVGDQTETTTTEFYSLAHAQEFMKEEVRKIIFNESMNMSHDVFVGSVTALLYQIEESTKVEYIFTVSLA